MENEKETSKNVVTSYRLSEDTKAKLKEQLTDLGLTQEEYFKKVVSVMEMEKIKQNNFLSKDTTIIQSNLDAILNAFINISDSTNNLLTNKNAELEEEKNKYKNMLINLQEVISVSKENFKEANEKISSLEVESHIDKNKLLKIRIESDQRLKEKENNLFDKTSLINEYKIKNDDLLGIVSEYKKYKPQVEEYKKLLADAQSKNILITDLNKKKDFNLDDLTKNFEILKQENQKEINTLRKENELNMRLAVSEIKGNLNNKADKILDKHNSEIEDYQIKYKKLLDEFTKLKVEHSTTKKYKIIK